MAQTPDMSINESPLVQEILAATDPVDKAAILAEASLENLGNEVAVTARQCILLHWFDLEIVAQIAPQEETNLSPREIYQKLQSLPFVIEIEAIENEAPNPNPLYYHSLTREGLIRRYISRSLDTLINGAKKGSPYL